LRIAGGLVRARFAIDAVGDDVQQRLPVGHVVRVAGFDRFPGEAGRVGCRKAERHLRGGRAAPGPAA